MSVTNDTARHLTTLVRLWIMAIRPRTLTIALVPVIAGSALAYYDSGQFRFAVFLATLLAALLIQAGTNLLNDAADFHRGGDGPDRIGPPRVTASGWIPAPQIAQAAFGCFALAGLLGLYLVWAGGWWIMALGFLSLLAAYSYSNGPWPISYSAFGEVFVIAFFGLAAVGGTYYLHSGTLNTPALIIGAATGLFAAAVLLVNNTRDRKTDRRAGRQTLAIRIGRSRARMVYPVMMLLPYLLLLGLPVPGLVWPVLAALPLSLHLSVRFWHEDGPALNGLLARTAQNQLFFGVLLVLGILAH